MGGTKRAEKFTLKKVMGRGWEKKSEKWPNRATKRETPILNWGREASTKRGRLYGKTR